MEGLQHDPSVAAFTQAVSSHCLVQYSQMKFWRALVAICAAFVVSSLQGCGDSDDDTAAAAPMDNTTTMMTETTTMMP